MQEALFDQAEPVMMSLNPEYYQLIWQGSKCHEFRRRYILGRPTTWFVYLTAPESRLVALIDLDTAVVDTPRQIANLAEQMRVGNGASVYEYLKDLPQGIALPIKRVREYPGLAIEELRGILPNFQPPQGYIRLNANPSWAALCEKLCVTDPIRELTI